MRVDTGLLSPQCDVVGSGTATPDWASLCSARPSLRQAGILVDMIRCGIWGRLITITLRLNPSLFSESARSDYMSVCECRIRCVKQRFWSWPSTGHRDHQRKARAPGHQWKARPSTNDNDISPAITTSAAKAYDRLQELHLKLNHPNTHIQPPPSCLVRRHRPSELVFVHYIY